jgi:hypothetical protein
MHIQLVFIYSTDYAFPIFVELEFSRQIFEKLSNIKYLENSFSGCRVFFMRTHRRNKSNSRVFQFCERDNNIKMDRFEICVSVCVCVCGLEESFYTLINKWFQYSWEYFLLTPFSQAYSIGFYIQQFVPR